MSNSAPRPLRREHVEALREAREASARGELVRAARICAQIQREVPGHPDVLFELGHAELSLGMAEEARHRYQAINRIRPGIPEVDLQLATCYEAEGRYDLAMQAVERSLERRPGFAAAIAKRAEILHGRGDVAEAHAVIDEAVEAGQRDAGSLALRARLAAVLRRDDEARKDIEAVLAMDDVAPQTRSAVLFEAAALEERAGNHPAAWQLAEHGNALVQRPFDAAAHAAMADRIIAAWTPEAIRELPTSRVRTDMPILVFGMPRSGTTLVEQILASHPRVAAGGERSSLIRLGAKLQRERPRNVPAHVDDLSVLTQRALDDLARGYLKDLKTVQREAQRAPIDGTHEAKRGVRHVTDKQPFSFLQLGVIARALPGATFIHTRRDPRDVAVSCFMQSFRGRVPFSTELERIVRFTEVHDRLMDHWRSVLDDLGIEMLEVDYERLVADQDAESRRLVAFAGLEWDDACLRFHEQPRTSRTASLDQVRRPMYRSSVQRWRRFEPALKPFLERLAAREMEGWDAGWTAIAAGQAPPGRGGG